MSTEKKFTTESAALEALKASGYGHDSAADCWVRGSSRAIVRVDDGEFFVEELL